MIKKSLKQKVECDIPLYSAKDNWRGRLSLPPNKTYQLLIDYPFSKEKVFNIKTTSKGLDLVSLVPLIHKSYIKKFKLAEKDDEDDYWHSIDDLVIEAIYVNHKTKKITLDIGS